MVKSTRMFFGQSMSVAINKSALTFDTQQSDFLFTVIATLSINLLLRLLRWLILLFFNLKLLCEFRKYLSLSLNTFLSQCIRFLGRLFYARFSKISQASTYSMMSKVLGKLLRRRSFYRWYT